MSQDAWKDAKDKKLIRSSWAKKTPKNSEKRPTFILINFLWFLAFFFSPGWSDSFHKFWVPTRGTLRNFYFWPIKGPQAILTGLEQSGLSCYRVGSYHFAIRISQRILCHSRHIHNLIFWNFGMSSSSVSRCRLIIISISGAKPGVRELLRIIEKMGATDRTNCLPTPSP